MDPLTNLTLAALIFAAAVLYSSVGHAGASGYLAAMALVGVAPAFMKPTALTLNILVATVGTYKFARAGCFDWRLFWPFAVMSIPLAFVGGWIQLPGIYYRPIVGAVLLFAAVRLAFASTQKPGEPVPTNLPPLPIAMLVGGAIGLLSGLTGVGGGIFLSPVILFAGWAGPRVTSGVSVTFILVNSIAGLLGQQLANVAQIPSEVVYWGVAALAGGWIGAELGSRRLNTTWFRRLLSVVLVIAGIKLAFPQKVTTLPPAESSPAVTSSTPADN
jgi:uncharacterized membrane protein YfcA